MSITRHTGLVMIASPVDTIVTTEAVYDRHGGEEDYSPRLSLRGSRGTRKQLRRLVQQAVFRDLISLDQARAYRGDPQRPLYALVPTRLVDCATGDDLGEASEDQIRASLRTTKGQFRDGAIGRLVFCDYEEMP